VSREYSQSEYQQGDRAAYQNRGAVLDWMHLTSIDASRDLFSETGGNW
jgi:hypothetical protein